MSIKRTSPTLQEMSKSMFCTKSNWPDIMCSYCNLFHYLITKKKQGTSFLRIKDNWPKSIENRAEVNGSTRNVRRCPLVKKRKVWSLLAVEKKTFIQKNTRINWSIQVNYKLWYFSEAQDAERKSDNTRKTIDTIITEKN
jgi:hypothetical protein